MMQQDADSLTQWKNLLDIDVLKGSINVVALYIMVYELLEDSVILKPKDFYTIIDFDAKAKKEYQDNVLSLYNKDVCQGISEKRKDIIASLIWFKNNGAIDNNDISVFSEAKALRNKLTHEMLSSVANGIGPLIEKFALMYGLFCKIEKWWIWEYEIPISGQFSNLTEEDKENIASGNMIILDMIIDILANNSNLHFKEVCDKLGVTVK